MSDKYQEVTEALAFADLVAKKCRARGHEYISATTPQAADTHSRKDVGRGLLVVAEIIENIAAAVGETVEVMDA